MKSKHLGRPPISAELITLIERMAAKNPLWSRRAAWKNHNLRKNVWICLDVPRPPRTTVPFAQRSHAHRHVNGNSGGSELKRGTQPRARARHPRSRRESN